MQPDRRTGRLEGRHALCQQPRHEPAEHIAGARRRQPCRSVVVDRGASVGRRDDGVGTLQITTAPLAVPPRERDRACCRQRAKKRVNSPSCGVSTTAPARCLSRHTALPAPVLAPCRAARSRSPPPAPAVRASPVNDVSASASSTVAASDASTSARCRPLPGRPRPPVRSAPRCSVCRSGTRRAPCRRPARAP